MANRTAETTVAGKALTLSPLTLGGLKRQRDNMVLLTELKDRTEALPTAAQLEAMAAVVADSAGLFPSVNDPKAAEKDTARAEFFAAVDELDFLEGMGQLGRAVALMMALSGLEKTKEGAGIVGATNLGEAAGS